MLSKFNTDLSSVCEPSRNTRANALRKFLEKVWSNGGLIINQYAHDVLIPAENLVSKGNYFPSGIGRLCFRIDVFFEDPSITHDFEFFYKKQTNKDKTILYFKDTALASLRFFSPLTLPNPVLDVRSVGVKYSDGDLVVLSLLDEDLDIREIKRNCMGKVANVRPDFPSNIDAYEAILRDGSQMNGWIIRDLEGRRV